MRMTVRVGLATVAVTAVAVLGFAGPAAAHIEVSPDRATPGGYARVALQVPDESDSASTVQLDVALPADQPIASVRVMAVPGWTVSTGTTRLATPIKTDDGDEVTTAVTKITWTATSADTGIKPGRFEEFVIWLGPLPNAGKLVLKAVQTYSDGTVVRWIDEPVEGQPEPEHPAPVLTLARQEPVGAQPVPDRTAFYLALLALLLGLAGTVLGVLAFTRSRGLGRFRR